MCRYILSLLADAITPVQQGIFVTCGLCQIQSHTKHSRLRPRIKITDNVKNSMLSSCHAEGKRSVKIILLHDTASQKLFSSRGILKYKENL